VSRASANAQLERRDVDRDRAPRAEFRKPAKALERELDLRHAGGERGAQRSDRLCADHAVLREAVSRLEAPHAVGERVAVAVVQRGCRIGGQVAQADQQLVQRGRALVSAAGHDLRTHGGERREQVGGRRGERTVTRQLRLETGVDRERGLRCVEERAESIRCNRPAQSGDEGRVARGRAIVGLDVLWPHASETEVGEKAQHRSGERDVRANRRFRCGGMIGGRADQLLQRPDVVVP